ncbi:hypothetical protein COB21_03455 [Candidatus Aerophobetes bacterium]|uniref:Uncharacterized protein n=1 Tax=Aerophobetes bacterium TaxID=2030807 RepID=A0A2A4X4Y6_UNCAE|nr:MAG: hypothetical protein COB21_03455 [Candidatus Aerophobetes bacterium]
MAIEAIDGEMNVEVTPFLGQDETVTAKWNGREITTTGTDADDNVKKSILGALKNSCQQHETALCSERVSTETVVAEDNAPVEISANDNVDTDESEVSQTSTENALVEIKG